MKRSDRWWLGSVLVLLAALPAIAQDQEPRRSQYPSPMVEHTRRHDRIQPAEYPGLHVVLEDVLPKPVDVYVSRRFRPEEPVDLVIYFHAVPYITHHAAESSGVGFIGVTVQLGGGSSSYNAPFEDPDMFGDLLDAVRDGLDDAEYEKEWNQIILAGFSAGYGAVRRILSQPENRDRVDAALLLDGIHASYVPERTVLYEGGTIETEHLAAFLSFAREASDPSSHKQFLITHSTVFPGTFVSTTEATDWILEQMDMERRPVLSWGPLGMQQVSEARKGNFAVLGFAGNSGVDHGDHLHAFGHFLRILSWGERPEH